MLEAIDSIVGQSALLRQVMGLPEKEDDFYDELSKYSLIMGKSLYRNTVKFLNFWTRENCAVRNLKFKKRGKTFGVFRQKDANGIANIGDPDQTAPLGAV